MSSKMSSKKKGGRMNKLEGRMDQLMGRMDKLSADLSYLQEYSIERVVVQFPAPGLGDNSHIQYIEDRHKDTLIYKFDTDEARTSGSSQDLSEGMIVAFVGTADEPYRHNVLHMGLKRMNEVIESIGYPFIITYFRPANLEDYRLRAIDAAEEAEEEAVKRETERAAVEKVEGAGGAAAATEDIQFEGGSFKRKSTRRKRKSTRRK